MSEPIRVLIVDDSPFMREVLETALGSEPSIEVIGTAGNGEEGVRMALQRHPNVITMDLQMPVMGGHEAIERIMREEPTPIIVVSSLNTDHIVRALDAGAMDFVAVTRGIEAVTADVIEKVKIASRVRPRRYVNLRPAGDRRPARRRSVFRAVAVGISTGGPQALRTVLSGLPSDFPAGVLIVQHMSPGFIDGMVRWLETASSLDIRVPVDGQVLDPGTVFIAPDRCHLEIARGRAVRLRGTSGDEAAHVPSIDVMMASVAETFGRDAIGVIMTGMGRDGVEGLRAIRRAGGVTIAQDEETSAVYGMNRAAVEAGVVDRVVPLERIAAEIVGIVTGKGE
jgi:two-component system chemotaxis response regulator CheB